MLAVTCVSMRNHAFWGRFHHVSGLIVEPPVYGLAVGCFGWCWICVGCNWADVFEGGRLGELGGCGRFGLVGLWF